MLINVYQLFSTFPSFNAVSGTSLSLSNNSLHVHCHNPFSFTVKVWHTVWELSSRKIPKTGCVPEQINLKSGASNSRACTYFHGTNYATVTRWNQFWWKCQTGYQEDHRTWRVPRGRMSLSIWQVELLKHLDQEPHSHTYNLRQAACHFKQ